MSKASDWVLEPFSKKKGVDLVIDLSTQEAKVKYAAVLRFIAELLGAIDTDPTLSRTAALLFRYLEEDKTLGQFIMDYSRQVDIEIAASLRSIDIKMGVLAEADDPASTMKQCTNLLLGNMNDMSRRLRGLEDGGNRPAVDGPELGKGVSVRMPGTGTSAQPGRSVATAPRDALQTDLNASAASVAINDDYTPAPHEEPSSSRQGSKRPGPAPGTAVRSGPFAATPTAKVLRVLAALNQSTGKFVHIDDIKRGLESVDVDFNQLSPTFLTSTLGNNAMRFGPKSWWIANKDLPEMALEFSKVLMPRNVQEKNEARTTVNRHNRSRSDNPLQMDYRKPAWRGGRNPSV